MSEITDSKETPFNASVKTKIEWDSSVENEDPILKCKYCIKTFLEQSLLNRHYKWHARAKNYACEYCNKGLGSIRSLRSHIKKIHEKSSLLKCTVCEKAYTVQSALDTHMASKHSALQCLCPCCGRTYDSISELEKHLEENKKKSYQCDWCPKNFTNESALRAHQICHENTCVTCCKSFGTKDQLDHHVLQKVAAEVFICSTCMEPYYNYLDFKRHILKHQKVKVFVCSTCDASFVEEMVLKQHLINVHNITFKKFNE